MARTSRTHIPAYRREGGSWLIELKLRETRQLFHTLDASPFHEKDLDPAAEAYIDEAVRELGAGKPTKLIVHLPAGEDSQEAQALPEAIAHYFEYRAGRAQAEIRRMLTLGLVNLVIGLAFLFACLSLIDSLADDARFEMITHGLLIIGWVALWRPVEIFLYDWWPIKRRQLRSKAIARMPVEVKFRQPPAAQ
jgi:hypothetical protein